MESFPTVVTLPFSDGVRDVPEHIAALLKGHKISTHEMTYAQAMARLDWANADQFLNESLAKIQNAHLRGFGR